MATTLVHAELVEGASRSSAKPSARRGGAELTPEQRSLRARIAAYTLHSRRDPRITTKPARDAFLARFEREVDPDLQLDEAERRRRAEAAKKAYFSALALKSSRARRSGTRD